MSEEILAAFNSETGTWDVIDEDDFYDMDKPEEALKKAYEKGRADGIAEANLNHNIECGDCVRQITTADEERIRTEERNAVLDKAYEMLGDELVWVLHEYGDDVYMDIANSITTVFQQLCEGEQNDG